jgi:signal transduction histidine kinase
MTLQRKFLLVVAMLGLAVLGSLGAVWLAFGMLQRELAVPLSETAGVLEPLRQLKRCAEDQASLIYQEGVSSQPPPLAYWPPSPWRPSSCPVPRWPVTFPPGTSATRGVRGPRGNPQYFKPTVEQRREFRRGQREANAIIEQINRSDASIARIGLSTWRNLKDRFTGINELERSWFMGDPRAQVEAGRTCYTVHELIEETEKQILKTARTAINSGDVIRGLLWRWLLSVIGVGVLGGLLALILLRRWVQKPVSALRKAAARIAQGDLQHRVPVRQRDELGLLSAEVNHMAQMVQVMQDERVERERLAAIGEMVRRIVHNVRNPLAGIRGLAEVTRLDLEKGSPDRENMDLIVSTVDKFERWLSELLDATSPSSIHPQQTDVKEWMSEIVDVHRSQAAARGITLELETSTAPGLASFDPKHLDHALSALVSNAIEATPEGGHVWVTARRPHENGSWEVEVVDNGRGVPADVLPRIFDLHFTTKRHGSGLGLAMVQQIIKGHAGRISVRNGDSAHPERCGACFVICLPIDPYKIQSER